MVPCMPHTGTFHTFPFKRKIAKAITSEVINHRRDVGTSCTYFKVIFKRTDSCLPGKVGSGPRAYTTEGFTLHSCRPTAVGRLPEKLTIQPENEHWTDLEGCP